jgi:hypothetical protein
MTIPPEVEKYFRALALKNTLDAEHKKIRVRLKELVRLRHNARVNEARIWKSIPANGRVGIEMGFYDEPDYNESPAEVTPSDQHILADVPASPFEDQ